MRDIDSIEPQEGQGFQFPGEFEITAMGNASADLQARVPQILEGIGVHVLHETVKHRHSREGNPFSPPSPRRRHGSISCFARTMIGVF